MNKEECQFRKRVPIHEDLAEHFKELHEKYPQMLGPFDGLTKDPVCTHEDAPHTTFFGHKDNYLCDVIIFGGDCPMGLKRGVGK